MKMPDPALADAARNRVVRIKKVDEDKRLVFGEVYAPDVLDTYGEFMSAEDIELMAHRFMKLDLGAVIDTNHDNVPNGSYPVESFVARASDPDFTEGAWVLGVHVPDDLVWASVKSGELNGFSFQSMVKPVEHRVKLSIIRDHVGKTEHGGAEDHSHTFFVQVDDNGSVVYGQSSFDNGHNHRIRRASVTETVNTHNHRYFL
jgi:hypothetical protein